MHPHRISCAWGATNMTFAPGRENPRAATAYNSDIGNLTRSVRHHVCIIRQIEVELIQRIIYYEPTRLCTYNQ
jgi:hypothetical protein